MSLGLTLAVLGAAIATIAGVGSAIEMCIRDRFRTVSGSNDAGIGNVPDTEEINDEIKLVECANPFYEAESAVSYIYELIRDKDYRMRCV